MAKTIAYVYDITADDDRTFNRVKRKFYYHLKKIKDANPEAITFVSKSVFLTSTPYEKDLDKLICSLEGIRCVKLYVDEYSHLC